MCKARLLVSDWLSALRSTIGVCAVGAALKFKFEQLFCAKRSREDRREAESRSARLKTPCLCSLHDFKNTQLLNYCPSGDKLSKMDPFTEVSRCAYYIRYVTLSTLTLMLANITLSWVWIAALTLPANANLPNVTFSISRMLLSTS